MSRLPSPALWVSVLSLSFVASASGEPGFARMFRGKYGYEPSCNACHTEGGGSAPNAYAEDLRKAGINPKGLEAIESLDSDRDGSANLAEIKAKSDPGSRQSTPDNRGDWLDPANLIPAEVRKLFPGIRTYKPLDAIFTPRDVERAKAFGVALGERDETTIYVPFDGERATGAAVIVPAVYEAKAFFLVVATDRDLKVQAVLPIASKEAPRTGDQKIFDSFVGMPVKQLSGLEEGKSLRGAIASCVKKAAAILYVRLTKE